MNLTSLNLVALKWSVNVSILNMNKITPLAQTKSLKYFVCKYFRNDAKEVENKAEKLVSGVKATQGAQENVTNILQQANQSIEVIKKDLAQVN